MAKQKLVILTGAGISAESGIATFRDSNGLWNNHRIEDVASPQGFARNPELVLQFYNMRRNDCIKAKPNAAHFGITKLEEKYELTIITQNVDDLHERAGSQHVIHLHGELMKKRSTKNEEITYPYTHDLRVGEPAPDGGVFRPFIVWFGEAVPKIEEATEHVYDADIFVIIGTSLAVYPAAGLINYVPNDSQIFIIDKHIPQHPNRKNLHLIEKVASQGVADLLNILL